MNEWVVTGRLSLDSSYDDKIVRGTGRNSFMLRESYWILANLLGENLCKNLRILLHSYTMCPASFYENLFGFLQNLLGENLCENGFSDSRRISSPDCQRLGHFSKYNRILTKSVRILCSHKLKVGTVESWPSPLVPYSTTNCLEPGYSSSTPQSWQFYQLINNNNDNKQKFIQRRIQSVMMRLT